jgi:hypothetical protein
MRSLVGLITAVLADEGEISELPTGELYPIDNEGVVVAESIEVTVALKIARLQTLIFREKEKGEMPETSMLPFYGPAAMASFLSVQEDATANIMMLERLIVEVVREAFPRESERFGVRYFLTSQRHLLCAESPQRRTLD